MWVTLEQTPAVPQRRPPSLLPSSIQQPPPNHNQVGQTRSETLTLSSHQLQIDPSTSLLAQPSSSPRARFAENPIIGPTRDPNNSQLVRRKSALKSRPTNQKPFLNPSNPFHVLHPSLHPSQQAPSISNPNGLLPNPALHRLRATSMSTNHPKPPGIRSDHHPHSQNFILTHPSTISLGLENLDPFQSRQRTHSMSDLSSTDPSANHPSALKTYDLARINTLPNPSISSHLGSHPIDKNKFLDHTHSIDKNKFLDHTHPPHSNLMEFLAPNSIIDHDHEFASTVYESFNLSDHSTRSFTISSANSSISSSLLDHYTTSSPPPPSPSSSSSNLLKDETHPYHETQKLGSTSNTPLDDHLIPSSFLSTINPNIENREDFNRLLPNFISDSFISPLERLSTLSQTCSSIHTRRRSGTVLPPKKPELFPELVSKDPSTIILPAHSIPLKSPEECPITPPIRPPRSNRRAVSSKPLDHPPVYFSSAILPGQAGVEPTVKPCDLRLTSPRVRSENLVEGSGLDSSHGSTKPNPIFSDAVVVMHHQNQSKPSIRLSLEASSQTSFDHKIPLDNCTNFQVNQHDLGFGDIPNQKVSDGKSRIEFLEALPTPTFEPIIIESPISLNFLNPFGASSGTDDEVDEFESAEEGDERFWSTTERVFLDHTLNNDLCTPHVDSDVVNKTLTRNQSSRASPPSKSPDELSRTQPSFHRVAVKEDGDKDGLKRERKCQQVPTMIGAFPHSESFPESLMSSWDTNSPIFEDFSLEGSLGSHIVPKNKTVGWNLEKSDHFGQPVSLDVPSPKTNSEGKSYLDNSHNHGVVSTLPIEPELSQQLAPPIPENSSSQDQGLHESSRTMKSSPTMMSPKSSFNNSSITPESSLDGLVAQRNSQSHLLQSAKKKSSISSVHLRPLSKILSFCSKDVSLQDLPNQAYSVVIPNQTHNHGEHRTRFNDPNPPYSSITSSSSKSQRASSPKSSSPPRVVSPQSTSPTTWKNSIPKSSYENLLNLYGNLEMRRQELIWELCETEQSFSTGLRQVLEIFGTPLRTQDGNWITGVPMNVAKLLDWLEDIVDLHNQISFQAKNCVQYQTKALGLVVHISEVFLDLIPKLEVYQAYLVRFSMVTASIDEMVNDLNSDFGEFVRMQSALPECGRMSLTSFLLKPIQRLMKYPLFFKQLNDVTPPDHPDHEATVNLLNSTDSMIRILQEVKEREDEYEKVKAWENKIRGLPSGIRLARRDRRLLAQGLLKRVQIPTQELQHLRSTHHHHHHHFLDPSSVTMALKSRSHQSNYNNQLYDSSDSNDRPSSDLMSKAYSKNSNSNQSNWSRNSNLSSNSNTSPTSRSSFHSISNSNHHQYNNSHQDRENDLPADNLLHRHYQSTTQQNRNQSKIRTSQESIDSNQRKNLDLIEEDSKHYSVRSQRKMKHTSLNYYYSNPLSNLSPIPSPLHRVGAIGLGLGLESNVIDFRNLRKSIPVNVKVMNRKPKESPVHVFVFSDLVLLATRHNDGVRLIRSSKITRKKKESSSYYSLLEDVGISRLISVSDISGEFDYPHLLKLEVLPCVGEGEEGKEGAGAGKREESDDEGKKKKEEGGRRKKMREPVTILLTLPDRGVRLNSNSDEMMMMKSNSSHSHGYGHRGEEDEIFVGESIKKERFRWFSAFDQTLRSTRLSLKESSLKNGENDDEDDLLSLEFFKDPQLEGEMKNDQELLHLIKNEDIGRDDMNEVEMIKLLRTSNKLQQVDLQRKFSNHKHKNRFESNWWSIRNRLIARELTPSFLHHHHLHRHHDHRLSSSSRIPSSSAQKD